VFFLKVNVMTLFLDLYFERRSFGVSWQHRENKVAL